MGMEKLASMINIGLMGVLIVVWSGALFFSSSWHMKASILYNAEISLWGMEVSHGSFVGGADFLLRGMGKDEQSLLSNLVVGSYSWQQAQAYMCQISKTFSMGFLGLNGCQVWRTLRTMSITLSLLILTGIIMLCLGSYFHYYYRFVKEARKTRLWCRGFLIMAPTCFMMGLTMYFFTTKRLADFPPQTGTTFGPSFVFSVFYCLLSFIPIAVHETFSGKDDNEDLREAQKAADKQEMFGLGEALQSTGQVVEANFPGFQSLVNQQQAFVSQSFGAQQGQSPLTEYVGNDSFMRSDAPLHSASRPMFGPDALQVPGGDGHIRASGRPLLAPTPGQNPGFGMSGTAGSGRDAGIGMALPAGMGAATHGQSLQPGLSDVGGHVRSSGRGMPVLETGASTLAGDSAARSGAAQLGKVEAAPISATDSTAATEIAPLGSAAPSGSASHQPEVNPAPVLAARDRAAESVTPHAASQPNIEVSTPQEMPHALVHGEASEAPNAAATGDSVNATMRTSERIPPPPGQS